MSRKRPLRPEVLQSVDKESKNADEKIKGDILSFKKLLKTFNLTENQRILLKKIKENDIIFILGPAGTGKTAITCYYAIEALAEHKFEKIICTKPIMEAGEKLGALPGTVEEKINPYYESYNQNFLTFLNKEKLTRLVEKKIIDYKPISYMRGATYSQTLLSLDEAQNLDAKSLILFLTRMGKDSKVIISGDVSQTDIKSEHVALPWLANLIKDIKGVAVFEFKEEDIMRNPILIEVTKRYERSKVEGSIPKNKYN